MNELVVMLNEQYKTIPETASKPFANVHYVDIDSGFSGHRFCEPGKSYRENYYSSDVWVWNLSPNTPADWKDPNQPEITQSESDYPDVQSPDSESFLQGLLGPGGQDTAEETIHINPGLGGESGSAPNGGIATRMFHPKQASSISITLGRDLH